jgi:enamine deaminase RidA (YjgF/YER057c/UK114 family)
MSTVEERLTALGLTVPQAAAPVANYVPFVIQDKTIYISGQVSNDANGGIKGKLGAGLSLEEGQAAARLCALSLLGQLKAALGDLSRVKRVIKLNGFVNVAPDFDAIPAVINGCSDLMVAAFEGAGRHARSAVGVANLPLGFAVEVDGVFEIE